MTLETRRLRGDMIEVFKIVKGFTNVDPGRFFQMSFTNLRGHRLKLYKKHVRTNTGKYFFSNRIVNTLNARYASYEFYISLRLSKLLPLCIPPGSPVAVTLSN